MKPFYNGFKRSSKEIPLELFLTDKKKEELKDYNLFYIIRPKADTTVFKIGVSNGINRLKSYLNTYGFTQKNKCTGCLLYYLIGTKKVKNLSENNIHNSHARQKEKQMIKDLSPHVERGNEYFRISKSKLYSALLSASKRGFTAKKKAALEDERKLEEDDKVLEILKHEPYKGDKKKIKSIIVRWNRPFTNTDPPDDTTKEYMRHLKKFNNKSGIWSKLKTYAKKHGLTYDTF